MKKIVVKIGTNVLSRPDGLLDLTAMSHLVDQIAGLKRSGIDVVVVSSGAVGAGRAILPLPSELDKVIQRQVLAAIGQPQLMRLYSELLQRYGLHCAQVLATKEDFRDRQHYLHMKNCFLALLRDKIIPVVNENDVVAVSELMFTDNDELAGLVASMTGADTLVILSSVDGVLTGPPGDPASQVIPEIDADDRASAGFITQEKSAFGRGGMMTKFRFARQAARVGVVTYIANGKRPNVLSDLAAGLPVGTRFTARQPLNNLKKWMAYQFADHKGVVVINAGAAERLRNGVSSLLPVGILRVEGEFDRGDLLQIVDENGATLGHGLAQYQAASARQWIGEKGKKPLVHYDYLYIL
ncbi:MAG: glutamate 5-kinase [Saprospiraceae bacterium]|nr:glutamate 5-kinase [Saprospiraceae bacterium]